jgi:uncharacterized delta-60 repeat protein
MSGCLHKQFNANFKIMKKKITTLANALMAFSWIAVAQPGTIDTSFGDVGAIFNNHVLNSNEFIEDMVVLPDNSFVIIGNTQSPNADILVAKYDANGNPDQTFGNSGFITIDLSIGGNDYGHAIELLDDGKFLITGSVQTMSGQDAYICRLHDDGQIDYSFGTGGQGYTLLNAGTMTIAQGRDIAVLPDNSILLLCSVNGIGSNSDLAVFKLTQGGGIDLTFAASGVSMFDVLGFNAVDIPECIDLLPDGRMVIGGHSTTDIRVAFVVMLNSYGLIEQGFNGTGYYIYNLFAINQKTMAINAKTGKIIAAGFTGNGANADGFVLRLNIDGTLDNTFGSNGIVTSNIGMTNGVYLRNIHLLNNGNILATGNVEGQSMNGPYALMLDQNGSPFSDFVPSGSVYPDLGIPIIGITGSASGIQSTGKILLGGYVFSPEFTGDNMYVQRLHGLDNSTGLKEHTSRPMVKAYPNPSASHFKIDLNDEEIISVEMFSNNGQFALYWRSNSNQFDIPLNVPNGVYVLKVQTENNIYSSRLTLAR